MVTSQSEVILSSGSHSTETLFSREVNKDFLTGHGAPPGPACHIPTIPDNHRIAKTTPMDWSTEIVVK